MTAADLIARADEIDSRLGPIPGRTADAIAVQLRDAAKTILAFDRLRARIEKEAEYFESRFGEYMGAGGNNIGKRLRAAIQDGEA